jgi:hypothetical protein
MNRLNDLVKYKTIREFSQYINECSREPAKKIISDNTWMIEEGYVEKSCIRCLDVSSIVYNLTEKGKLLGENKLFGSLFKMLCYDLKKFRFF